MAEVPQSPPPEALQIPEHLQYDPNLASLQTRMLLGGDALDPKNNNLPDVTVDSLRATTQKRQETTYKYLNAASQKERRDYWEKQGIEGFDAKKQKWVEKTVASFQNSKAFFEKSGWDKIFTKLRISSQDFTAQDAEELYRFYFSGNGVEPVMRFISTTIQRGYVKTVDGKNQLNYKNLKNDLPALQWLAGMFGTQAAEIIAQLTDAQGKIHIDEETQKLIDETNKKEKVGDEEKSKTNRPSEKEVGMLNYMMMGKEEAEKTPAPSPEPKPEPQPKPEETNKPPIETPAEIADSLMDYETGTVKEGYNTDLSASFEQLATQVAGIFEDEEMLNQIKEDTPNILLSGVALNMVDRIATEANKKNRELGFYLRGIKLKKDNKTVYLVSHVVPAMDFSQPVVNEMQTDIGIEKKRAEEIAKSLGLDKFFQQTVKNSIGDLLAVCHVHQDSLGEGLRGKPSKKDKEIAIPEVLKINNLNEITWAVITAHNGKLDFGGFTSRKKADGTITHEDSPIRAI